MTAKDPKKTLKTKKSSSQSVRGRTGGRGILDDSRVDASVAQALTAIEKLYNQRSDHMPNYPKKGIKDKKLIKQVTNICSHYWPDKDDATGSTVASFQATAGAISKHIDKIIELHAALPVVIVEDIMSRKYDISKAGKDSYRDSIIKRRKALKFFLPQLMIYGRDCEIFSASKIDKSYHTTKHINKATARTIGLWELISGSPYKFSSDKIEGTLTGVGGWFVTQICCAIDNEIEASQVTSSVEKCRKDRNSSKKQQSL